MKCSWKPNWEETKEHYRRFWRREGMVVITNGAPLPAGFEPHERLERPPEKKVVADRFTDPRWRAAQNHYNLANSYFPLDTLPVTCSNFGPGNLATFIGSEPDYQENTVWFHPCFAHEQQPEKLPPLKFDPENKWFKIMRETLELNAKLGRGKYITGCPDLIENIDILASLRDAQVLLMDLIERPEWIERKVFEINQVFFDAYSMVYDIIKGEDGSAAFWAFDLWGEGKTAKVQCDASAMFSPDMFRRFVVPALEEQCRWLDYSLFHLDGSQCLCHLDLILAIDSLDAVEWTPDPSVPRGGDSHWHSLYKRILDAGKCVQALGVLPHQIQPLLDAIGTNGVFLCCSVKTPEELDTVQEIVGRYRKN